MPCNCQLCEGPFFCGVNLGGMGVGGPRILITPERTQKACTCLMHFRNVRLDRNGLIDTGEGIIET